MEEANAHCVLATHFYQTDNKQDKNWAEENPRSPHIFDTLLQTFMFPREFASASGMITHTGHRRSYRRMCPIKTEAILPGIQTEEESHTSRSNQGQTEGRVDN